MPKRILQGTVVSIKREKTATVLVTRRFTHPIYKKTMKSTKKYHAHDEFNTAVEGSVVRIIESKPISKTKKWMIIQE